MAGYSKRSLVEKLGMKADWKVLILNAPADYDTLLGSLPENVKRTDKAKGEFEFIQFFTTDRKELEREFPKLQKQITQAGMFWISWPKGASKIKTDLNENVIRDIGVHNGMVDVKVIAVDDDWSGLKFVYRLKDRKIEPQRARSARS